MHGVVVIEVVVRCDANPMAILDDGSAGHMEVNIAIRRLVHAHLKTNEQEASTNETIKVEERRKRKLSNTLVYDQASWR